MQGEMKRTLAILVLCLLALGLMGAGEPAEKPAKATTPLGKWEGFRGIKWGATLEQTEGMVLIAGNELRSAYYMRPTDKMAIGEAAIDRINYAFYKGRFFSATIKCTGTESSAALKRAVLARYGEGEQPNAFTEKYHWHSGKPGELYGDVGMSLSCDEYSVDEKTMLTFLYLPISDQKKADQKKAAEAAGVDF